MNVPWERLLFRSRDRAGALERFAATLPAATVGGTIGSAGSETQSSAPTQNPSKIAPQSLSETSALSLPTTEETVAYQNRELGKQLLLLEMHLGQGCRIPPITGEPCDCCSPKHTLTIEALAIETYTIHPQPVYQELAEWARGVEAKTTIEEIKGGKHDYGPDAAKARAFRKRILGTESLGALKTPEKMISLEEAKQEAAQIAAERVEKQWQSQGKK